ncbi:MULTISPECIES: hypothetical protein [Kitasatospora]|uniref:FtsH-binding integral membrane protein n=2 Tax=Kitasatospora TaxID=2063 RepID=A0ABT1IQX6_9ACTN|nr:hypothetical protein [Kitasatospora paracochleata]MCP2307336.1 FtsH-binding integral membrane protein [Kitasatospora paracochleata]
MELSGAQFWGAVTAVTAALAVVAGYLLGGPRMVWAVSAVEVLVLMAYVGWKFRAKAHVRTAGEGPDAAHCERCRRARERLDAA